MTSINHTIVGEWRRQGMTSQSCMFGREDQGRRVPVRDNLSERCRNDVDYVTETSISPPRLFRRNCGAEIDILATSTSFRRVISHLGPLVIIGVSEFINTSLPCALAYISVSGVFHKVHLPSAGGEVGEVAGAAKSGVVYRQYSYHFRAGGLCLLHKQQVSK